MRQIAIINEKEYAIQNVKKIVSDINRWNVSSEITIFTKYSQMFNDVSNVRIVEIPSDKTNRPKIKNFVIKYFKENNSNDILHVLEEKIKINIDPTKFIFDIEQMMNVYDLNCWFDTVTDGCNYLYSKYNPRLDIHIDNQEYVNKLNITNAIFCSHSNVQWTIYNLNKADDDELYFNEIFDIDMFFIIEFLARRRNKHPNSLYFMNQYFTCASEKGVFEIDYSIGKDEAQEDLNEQMRKEDSIFKSMNIDYSPDNNIDKVLEILYGKLKEKIDLS